jgi:hypothetical protein
MKTHLALFFFLNTVLCWAQTEQPANQPAGKVSVPFSFKVTTPEFTSGNWWQFLGVSLNVLDTPTITSKGAMAHKGREWFLTGKGTPLLKGSLTPQHELSTQWGALTLSSIPSDRQSLTRDPNALSIAYSNLVPISRSAGSSYIVVSGNAPAPTLKVGDGLRLRVWARHTIRSSKTPQLQVTGYAATFGGDIFTEAPLRLGLSYNKKDSTYAIPAYDIITSQGTYTYSAALNNELKAQFSNTQRVHSADSARGLTSRQGFVLDSVWSELSTGVFAVEAWDLNTNIVSFEITFQLPYDPHSTANSPVQWQHTAGTIELSGFTWERIENK